MTSLKKKNAICFIDDDAAEIGRFYRNLKDDFIIGAGTTLEKAIADLPKGIKKPKLFVLDMYFPVDYQNTKEELEELHQARGKFLEANTEFSIILKKLKQSSEGGILLSNNIIKEYPKTPYIFFTRKGTLDDCMKGYKFGAKNVIKKPDPNRSEMKADISLEESYDKAFEKNVDKVSEAINDVIKQATWWWRNKKTIYGLIAGFFLGVIGSVIANIMTS